VNEVENVCQFSYGDRVMFRMYGTGDAIPGYITAVDVPTRRLRICYGDDGTQVWQYMEWCYKLD
jgi:hypothetical protein